LRIRCALKGAELPEFFNMFLRRAAGRKSVGREEYCVLLEEGTPDQGKDPIPQ